MLRNWSQSLCAASRGLRSAAASKPALPSESLPLPDRLFRSLELEYRGHDPAVLRSYTQFLETTCKHLDIRLGEVKVLPYVRWIQPLLRSKFVHKKYKVHYETRTHITRFKVHDLTGSTASTFLEYIERNTPEGVGMRVEYEEVRPLPDTIVLATERSTVATEGAQKAMSKKQKNKSSD